MVRGLIHRHLAIERVLAFSLLAAAVGASGCAYSRKTQTARTGVEELLLSTAADRAIRKIDASPLKGRKTFFDVSHLDCVDKGYVIDALMDRLLAGGAVLVDDKKQADVIVSARCGALATDDSDTLIGAPPIPFPLIGAGTVEFPELPFFKATNQTGVAKLAVHAYDHKAGGQLMSTGPLSGRSYYDRYKILMISWHTTDIPEKQKRSVIQEAARLIPTTQPTAEEGPSTAEKEPRHVR